MFAGQVVDAPYGNPFAAFMLNDPTLRVTFRRFLSDVYATYENAQYVFQMFTYKPFPSDKTYVFVQFLKPAPERWFDLRVQREVDLFQQHQRCFMGPSFAMQLTEGGPSKRPAASVAQVEEPNKRQRSKRLTTNEVTIKNLLLSAMTPRSKQTNVGEGLFANGEPCVELSSPTKQGSFDIVLKFSVKKEDLIQVYFQKRSIYLFFELSRPDTCGECVRQVLSGIISLSGII